MRSFTDAMRATSHRIVSPQVTMERGAPNTGANSSSERRNGIAISAAKIGDLQLGSPGRHGKLAQLFRGLAKASPITARDRSGAIIAHSGPHADAII